VEDKILYKKLKEIKYMFNDNLLFVSRANDVLILNKREAVALHKFLEEALKGT